jgi:hypothetical protein
LPIDFALLFEKIFSKTLDKIKEIWYNIIEVRNIILWIKKSL